MNKRTICMVTVSAIIWCCYQNTKPDNEVLCRTKQKKLSKQIKKIKLHTKKHPTTKAEKITVPKIKIYKKLSQQSLKLIHMSKFYDSEARQAAIYDTWIDSHQVHEIVKDYFINPSPKNAVIRVGYLSFLKHQRRNHKIEYLEKMLLHLIKHTGQNQARHLHDFKELFYLYISSQTQEYTPSDLEDKIRKADVSAPLYKDVMVKELFLWLRQYFENNELAYNEAKRLTMHLQPPESNPKTNHYQ